MFVIYVVFFFKQKTAYEMRISDWSSDVCSSDLVSNVTTTPAKTLAAAREEIVKILTDQKAAEAMSDFLANAEDQIAGGTTFEEFAKDASHPIKATPLIVSGGVSPQKPDYQPAPEISEVLKQAFERGRVRDRAEERRVG